MKRLVCEMCGGTDLIKQDGVFVCQSCGCKYSVEEARKLMVEIEGTVEVTGTVRVDNTAAIDNYLKMAESALEATNNEEAENYANKIIEIDPCNSAAWRIKGEAAGWQSKTNNNRMGESVNAWINAVQYSQEEDKTELRERIANVFMNLLLAMTQLRCDNFANIQDEERLNGLLNDVKRGVDLMNTLVVKAGISFNRSPIYTQLARKMNSAACDGYKDAKKDFGPEHHNMSKWQWERFTDSCDNCIKLLEGALVYCRDNSLGKTMCDNLVTIAEDARDSCSWKFDVNSWTADHYVKDFSFTDGAKEARTKNINNYKSKKEYFEKNHIEEFKGYISGGRAQEDIERGKKIYWEEHAEEKAQLEAERDRLRAEISDAESRLNTMPIRKQMEETLKKKESLQQEMGKLGAFKGKEKKALQAQIDDLTALYNRQTAAEAAARGPLMETLNRNRARVADIAVEFAKSRGAVPENASNFYMGKVLEDNKFIITPRQLADHLASILPYPYKFTGISYSSSAMDEFGTQMEINFILEDQPEDSNSIAVNLYCTAEDEDSPIENIILEGLTGAKANEKVGKNWGIIGSYLFMSLFEEMDQGDAEDNVLNIRYTSDRTLWVRDNIRYEYASVDIGIMNVLTLTKDLLILRPKF